MPAASAYDRALELCPTPEAKLVLARLAAELKLSPSAPEWVILTLYAEARLLFGPNENERVARRAQMDRIEARVEQTVSQATLESALRRSPKTSKQIEVGLRDLYVFVTALLLFGVVAITGRELPPPPVFILLAAFVFGVCAALLYLGLPPAFTRRK